MFFRTKNSRKNEKSSPAYVRISLAHLSLSLKALLICQKKSNNRKSGNAMPTRPLTGNPTVSRVHLRQTEAECHQRVYVTVVSRVYNSIG